MVKDSEIEIERQLAFAQTIYSPSYLESRIKDYQDEIARCRDMIKFYKRNLKEVTDPKTKSYKISTKYKLQ